MQPGDEIEFRRPLGAEAAAVIGTVVAVDAADLERLVRLAHQINADVATFVQYTPYECTCGLRLGPSLDDSDDCTDPVWLVDKLQTEARGRHATHLAYHLRQALAGRIEFP